MDRSWPVGSVDGRILLWDMSPYITPPTAVHLSAARPERTALLDNYPNPFNPETWIPYQLQAPAHVRLGIYDLQGALVRILDLGHRPAPPGGTAATSAASGSPAACICTAWRPDLSPRQARWSSSSEEGRRHLRAVPADARRRTAATDRKHREPSNRVMEELSMAGRCPDPCRFWLPETCSAPGALGRQTKSDSAIHVHRVLSTFPEECTTVSFEMADDINPLHAHV